MGPWLHAAENGLVVCDATGTSADGSLGYAKFVERWIGGATSPAVGRWESAWIWGCVGIGGVGGWGALPPEWRARARGRESGQ